MDRSGFVLRLVGVPHRRNSGGRAEFLLLFQDFLHPTILSHHSDLLSVDRPLHAFGMDLRSVFSAAYPSGLAALGSLGDCGAFLVSSKSLNDALRAACDMVALAYMVLGDRRTVLPSGSFSNPVLVHAPADCVSFVRCSCRALLQDPSPRICAHAVLAGVHMDALSGRCASAWSAWCYLLARSQIPGMAVREPKTFIWGVWAPAGGDGRSGNLVLESKRTSYADRRLHLDRSLLSLVILARAVRCGQSARENCSLWLAPRVGPHLLLRLFGSLCREIFLLQLSHT